MEASNGKKSFQQTIKEAIIIGVIPPVVVGFTVTGTLYKNQKKRFSYKCNVGGLVYARDVNLWSGTLWANIEDGTRVLIRRTKNGRKEGIKI